MPAATATAGAAVEEEEEEEEEEEDDDAPKSARLGLDDACAEAELEDADGRCAGRAKGDTKDELEATDGVGGAIPALVEWGGWRDG